MKEKNKPLDYASLYKTNKNKLFEILVTAYRKGNFYKMRMCKLLNIRYESFKQWSKNKEDILKLLRDEVADNHKDLQVKTLVNKVDKKYKDTEAEELHETIDKDSLKYKKILSYQTVNHDKMIELFSNQDIRKSIRNGLLECALDRKESWAYKLILKYFYTIPDDSNFIRQDIQNNIQVVNQKDQGMRNNEDEKPRTVITSSDVIPVKTADEIERESKNERSND